MKEGCIPEDWKSTVVLPTYKGKGNPLECGSYRGIQLLEHAMKVVEKIFKHRIPQQTEQNDMQFGFVKSKGTTASIFIVRQTQGFWQQKTRVPGLSRCCLCDPMISRFDNTGTYRTHTHIHTVTHTR